MIASPRVPSDRRLFVVVGVSGLFAALSIGLLVTLGFDEMNAVDQRWHNAMSVAREEASWFMHVSHALDWVGGGWRGVFFVPVLIGAVLLLMKQRWDALFFISASALCAAVVQLMKFVASRDRPQNMLVTSDMGSSPSGHVANATVMALVVALLVRRSWCWVLGTVYVLAMILSRTYLNAHWLTDTFSGVTLAVGVVLLLAAIIPGSTSRGRRDHTTLDPHSIRPV